MTVTYTAEVATSSFACFLKLLLRWRGSIYKLLWREFLLFTLCYYLLSFIYRFALNEDQRRTFESVSRYCEGNSSLIPVAFVLGFYVSIVVSRWWEQFNKIPWPDRMALFVMASVHGHDERGRLMRRTIMRYLCLSHVITMSSISPSVKKRFPTFQHMTEAGFMLPNEQKIMEEIKTNNNKYFVPLIWTTSLVARARKEQRIKDDFAVKTLIDEINEYRGMLGTLFNYDWISVPLVYTQVVTLAVYMFFLSCLMGRQFLDPPNTQKSDMYIPVFTFLQFFFYMGWLKVAESLVNPFGEDDDDFDINYVIDRNLQVSYLVVDEMHLDHPELIKDAYWDDVDFEVPYTAAAEQFRVSNPHLGSAMDIRKVFGSVEPRGAEFTMPLNSIQEDIAFVNVEKRGVNIPRGSKKANAAGYKNSYSSNNKPGILAFLKCSVSKDSRGTAFTDSPRLNKRNIKRLDSVTTQGTSPPRSPTITSRQDDIFAMSDFSDTEDDMLSRGGDSNVRSDIIRNAVRYKMATDRDNQQNMSANAHGRSMKRSVSDDLASITGSQVTLKSIREDPLNPIDELRQLVTSMDQIGEAKSQANVDKMADSRVASSKPRAAVVREGATPGKVEVVESSPPTEGSTESQGGQNSASPLLSPGGSGSSQFLFDDLDGKKEVKYKNERNKDQNKDREKNFSST